MPRPERKHVCWPDNDRAGWQSAHVIKLWQLSKQITNDLRCLQPHQCPVNPTPGVNVAK